MPGETNKKRILHVDDEEDTLTVVKKVLEDEGYEVVSLKRGKAALAAVKSASFDLLILDIMLPDMSGWELFSSLGKMKPGYRVMFLSILDITEEKLKELLNEGIVDYIKKPFDNDDLVKRVKKALATK